MYSSSEVLNKICMPLPHLFGIPKENYRIRYSHRFKTIRNVGLLQNLYDFEIAHPVSLGDS